jgi:deazaflavin-dependent oxidoreductase (nitroreductase family)
MTLQQIRLTTIGRKTGQEHEVTIYAFHDGDDLVVVGSYAGRPKDPDWAANLKANPRATVKKGRETIEHQARVVDGAERERLWKLVVEAFPDYQTYQGRTDRLIPLFVLEPAD